MVYLGIFFVGDLWSKETLLEKKIVKYDPDPPWIDSETDNKHISDMLIENAPDESTKAFLFDLTCYDCIGTGGTTEERAGGHKETIECEYCCGTGMDMERTDKFEKKTGTTLHQRNSIAASETWLKGCSCGAIDMNDETQRASHRPSNTDPCALLPKKWWFYEFNNRH